MPSGLCSLCNKDCDDVNPYTIKEVASGTGMVYSIGPSGADQELEPPAAAVRRNGQVALCSACYQRCKAATLPSQEASEGGSRKRKADPEPLEPPPAPPASQSTAAELATFLAKDQARFNDKAYLDEYLERHRASARYFQRKIAELERQERMAARAAAGRRRRR